MRTAFIQELIQQARIHKELFLTVGDLGFSVVEPFAEEFPDRFLNAGVAEQNMSGVAAGLASEGYHVFVYSIANFPTLRCLEQVRNDVTYHNLPVTFVSVGAGVAYGNLGYSHHAVQDIGILRTLSGLTILSPADPGETRECLRWLVEHPGPAYLRLGKAGEPDLHTVRDFAPGPLVVVPGNGTCAIACTGAILGVALQAEQQLRARGLDIAVFSCPLLQPVSADHFRALSRFQRVICLEEHVSAGGFGALLRERLPNTTQITSLAIPPAALDAVGGRDYILGLAGLTPSAVVATVLNYPT